VFATALVPNNTYNLSVRTADAHGDGAWSALLPFTVNPIPGAPTAIVVTVPPVVTQMNLPNGPAFNIAWTNDDFGFDAAELRVAIFDATNTTLLQNLPIAAAGPGNTGTFTPAALTPGTTYTVRLRVGDNASASTLAEFSPAGTVQFRVSAPPTIAGVDVTTKTGGLVNTVFPTFNWTHGDPDADAMSAYRITVSRTSASCAPNCPPASPGTPFLTWDSGVEPLVIADGPLWPWSTARSTSRASARTSPTSSRS
jgi:hypothetical protein